MAEVLGTDMSANNLKIVQVILDMCHMVKLIRNNLFKQSFIVKDGKRIIWKFHAMLEELQTVEGLHLGTKLTPSHINFDGEKMKVKLAVQLFSEFTTSGLDYMRKTDYPGFEQSEETAIFDRLINDDFDIFNSKNGNATHLKKPLQKENSENIFKKLA
jgi:hypothetical protein